jgi:serine/threonine protein phosphatase PrpC
MDFKVFGLSDKGKIRDNNQDSFLLNEPEKLFLVADGLGGRASGDIASELAVKNFEAFMIESHEEKIKWPIKKRSSLSIEENRLLAAAVVSNHKIKSKGKKDPSLNGMGAALLGVKINDDHLAVINIGDCRLYRIRDNAITQLTKDQTLVGEEERRGHITKEEAEKHPKKHILSSALGHLGKRSKMGLFQTDIQEKDLFLLCTDGLYGMIDDNNILSIINDIREKSLYQIGITLVLKANLAGGIDNITIVLLSFD